MNGRKIKCKEILRYLLCGLQTTVVNFMIFWIFTELLEFSTMLSTGLAWLLSAMFAYYTNKTFVFKSKRNSLFDLRKEWYAFFQVRIVSGIFEIIAMVFLVDFLHAPKMWMKLMVGIIVTVVNYIASKGYVFQNTQMGEQG